MSGEDTKVVAEMTVNIEERFRELSTQVESATALYWHEGDRYTGPLSPCGIVRTSTRATYLVLAERVNGHDVGVGDTFPNVMMTALLDPDFKLVHWNDERRELHEIGCIDSRDGSMRAAVTEQSELTVLYPPGAQDEASATAQPRIDEMSTDETLLSGFEGLWRESARTLLTERDHDLLTDAAGAFERLAQQERERLAPYIDVLFSRLALRSLGGGEVDHRTAFVCSVAGLELGVVGNVPAVGCVLLQAIADDTGSLERDQRVIGGAWHALRQLPPGCESQALLTEKLTERFQSLTDRYRRALEAGNLEYSKFWLIIRHTLLLVIGSQGVKTAQVFLERIATKDVDGNEDPSAHAARVALECFGTTRAEAMWQRLTSERVTSQEESLASAHSGPDLAGFSERERETVFGLARARTESAISDACEALQNLPRPVVAARQAHWDRCLETVAFGVPLPAELRLRLCVGILATGQCTSDRLVGLMLPMLVPKEAADLDSVIVTAGVLMKVPPHLGDAVARECAAASRDAVRLARVYQVNAARAIVERGHDLNAVSADETFNRWGGFVLVCTLITAALGGRDGRRWLHWQRLRNPGDVISFALAQQASTAGAMFNAFRPDAWKWRQRIRAAAWMIAAGVAVGLVAAIHHLGQVTTVVGIVVVVGAARWLAPRVPNLVGLAIGVAFVVPVVAVGVLARSDVRIAQVELERKPATAPAPARSIEPTVPPTEKPSKPSPVVPAKLDRASPRAVLDAQHAALRRGDLRALAELASGAFAFGVDAADVATDRAAIEAQLRANLGSPPRVGYSIASSQLTIGETADAAWTSERLRVRSSSAVRDFVITQYLRRDPAEPPVWNIIAWHWSLPVRDAIAEQLAAGNALPPPAAVTALHAAADPLHEARNAFGNREAFANSVSSRRDAVNLGTAGERMVGGPVIARVFRKFPAELRIIDGIRMAGDEQGYPTAGISNFTAANVEVKLARENGELTQRFRVLLVWLAEPAGWRIVQAHWSIGGPIPAVESATEPADQ